MFKFKHGGMLLLVAKAERFLALPGQSIGESVSNPVSKNKLEKWLRETFRIFFWLPHAMRVCTRTHRQSLQVCGASVEMSVSCLLQNKSLRALAARPWRLCDVPSGLAVFESHHSLCLMKGACTGTASSLTYETIARSPVSFGSMKF